MALDAKRLCSDYFLSLIAPSRLAPVRLAFFMFNLVTFAAVKLVMRSVSIVISTLILERTCNSKDSFSL